jgi:hypothetical protein
MTAHWSGEIAHPTITARSAEDTVTLSWPEGEPDLCLFTRDAVEVIVAELNELRALRREVESLRDARRPWWRWLGGAA